MCLRVFKVILCLVFSLQSVGPLAGVAFGQMPFTQTGLNLPVPGTMVTPTEGFHPLLIRGVSVSEDNPLRFEFILDAGDTALADEALKEESRRLVKYFLAALTIPEEELWVNLSPYEKDRIIPHQFSQTEMGRDLLAQDYLLKQLTASLMYPEDELGKVFWERVYKKAQEQFGTTEIPLDAFNKIWIVPEKSIIYEKGNSAFVVESYLKVMTEEDYLALSSSLIAHGEKGPHVDSQELTAKSQELKPITAIIRELLIPEIEREVNGGKTFAPLRQIYNAVILANWYKDRLAQGLLGQLYVDQNKITGIDIADRKVSQKIYGQYLEAFKKGVFNYVKEDYDAENQQIVPKKYFSGGSHIGRRPAQQIYTQTTPTDMASLGRPLLRMNVNLEEIGSNAQVKDPAQLSKVVNEEEENSNNTSLAIQSLFSKEEFDQDPRTPLEIFLKYYPQYKTNDHRLSFQDEFDRQYGKGIDIMAVFAEIFHKAHHHANPNAFLSRAIKSQDSSIPDYVRAFMRDVMTFCARAKSLNDQTRDALIFLWKLGDLAAQKRYTRHQMEQSLWQYEDPFPLIDEIPNQADTALPILDIAGGPGAVFYMKSLKDTDRLMIMDKSFFMVSFLRHHIDRYLPKKASMIDIMWADARDLDKVFPPGMKFRHIRLGLLDMFVKKLPDNYAEQLLQRVTSGGSVSYEYQSERELPTPTLTALMKLVEKDNEWGRSVEGKKISYADLSSSLNFDFVYFLKSGKALREQPRMKSLAPAGQTASKQVDVSSPDQVRGYSDGTINFYYVTEDPTPDQIQKLKEAVRTADVVIGEVPHIHTEQYGIDGHRKFDTPDAVSKGTITLKEALDQIREHWKIYHGSGFPPKATELFVRTIYNSQKYVLGDNPYSQNDVMQVMKKYEKDFPIIFEPLQPTKNDKRYYELIFHKKPAGRKEQKDEHPRALAIPISGEINEIINLKRGTLEELGRTISYLTLFTDDKIETAREQWYGKYATYPNILVIKSYLGHLHLFHKKIKGEHKVKITRTNQNARENFTLDWQEVLKIALKNLKITTDKGPVGEERVLQGIVQDLLNLGVPYESLEDDVGRLGNAIARKVHREDFEKLLESVQEHPHPLGVVEKEELAPVLEDVIFFHSLHELWKGLVSLGIVAEGEDGRGEILPALLTWDKQEDVGILRVDRDRRKVIVALLEKKMNASMRRILGNWLLERKLATAEEVVKIFGDNTHSSVGDAEGSKKDTAMQARGTEPTRASVLMKLAYALTLDEEGRFYLNKNQLTKDDRSFLLGLLKNSSDGPVLEIAHDLLIRERAVLVSPQEIVGALKKGEWPFDLVKALQLERVMIMGVGLIMDMALRRDEFLGLEASDKDSFSHAWQKLSRQINEMGIRGISLSIQPDEDLGKARARIEENIDKFLLAHFNSLLRKMAFADLDEKEMVGILDGLSVIRRDRPAGIAAARVRAILKVKIAPVEKAIEELRNPLSVHTAKNLNQLQPYLSSPARTLIDELPEPERPWEKWDEVSFPSYAGAPVPKVRMYFNRVGMNSIRGPYKGGNRVVNAADLMKTSFRDAWERFKKLQPSVRQAERFVAKWFSEEEAALGVKMAIKSAGLGLPMGGGKGVIFTGHVARKGDELFIEDNQDWKEMDYHAQAAVIERHAMAMTEDGIMGYERDVPSVDLGLNENHADLYEEAHLYKLWKKGIIQESDPELHVILGESLKQDPFDITKLRLLKITTRYWEDHLNDPSPKPVPWLGAITNKSEEHGAAYGRNEATGYGLVDIIEGILGEKLKGQTVAIQGFGDVGKNAALRLAEREAIVRILGNTQVTLNKQSGWQPDELRALINTKKRLHAAWDDPGLGLSRDGVVETRGDDDREKALLEADVDILIPSAVHGVIHKGNADRVRAKLIVAGANGAVTPEAEEILSQKGIRVVVDTLANAGGILVSYFEMLQAQYGVRFTRDQIEKMRKHFMLNALKATQAKMNENPGMSMKTAFESIALENIQKSKEFLERLSATRTQQGLIEEINKTRGLEVELPGDFKVEKVVVKITDLNVVLHEVIYPLERLHRETGKGPLKDFIDGIVFQTKEQITRELSQNKYPSDQALLGSPQHNLKSANVEEVGGINLSPKLLDRQIIRDENFVPLPLNRQPVPTLRIEGFVPIIIDISPMPLKEFIMLLGLADEKDETISQPVIASPESARRSRSTEIARAKRRQKRSQ
ncbi:MAG: hypothetical protein A2Z81_06195 [Omnitrophica WOR_2 bacterium GWA2_45_18]|nr:MAG: hypothetical protein A2Z81_06195 [Omnitrophica WOR_2 bacterium GWA2_45_18]